MRAGAIARPSPCSRSHAGRAKVPVYGARHYPRKDVLDLDRHCSVIIAPSGAPCMRSLTCKSHSVASKRAVIGRSRDFDMLLAEYLLTNPAKAQSLAVPGRPGDTKAALSGAPDRTLLLSDLAHATWYGLPARPFLPPPSSAAGAASPSRRIHWLADNLKMWISEPLRLYSLSRKGPEANPSKQFP